MATELVRMLSILSDRLPTQPTALSGVPSGGSAVTVAAIASRSQLPTLCLVETRTLAERLTEDLEALTETEARPSLARLYPESEMSLFDQGEADPDRLRVLHELHRGLPLVVVAPLLAFLQSAPAPKRLRRRCLEVGDELDLAQLLQLLVSWEYRINDLVAAPGQIAPRSEILDLYPSTEEPLRLKVCQGKLVGIWRLSLETQRSGQALDSVELLPMVEPSGQEALLDYFDQGASIVLLEKEQLRRRLQEMAKETSSGRRYSAYEDVDILADDSRDDWAQVEASLGSRPRWELTAEGQGLFSELPTFEDMEEFASWVKARDSKAPLTIVTQHPKRLRQTLSRLRIKAVKVQEGLLSAGVGADGLFDLVSDRELFGIVAGLRPRGQWSSGPAIEGLREGDLVVHAQRGIGRFFGLVPVELTGVRQDMVRLQYANDGVLMVPPEQMRELTVYRGPEDHEPALSRLDTPGWGKTMAKTLESVLSTAKALKSSAARQAKRTAAAIGPDLPEQEELEEGFPFDETPSQLAAISEIKADLERETAMDRLLCGDVGYGKTEVALRAAFKALSHGFQVALLAPTTVLAQQHFDSFQRRMKPLGVEVLGLWADAEEGEETLSRLAQGESAMVVGTHRLLSKEVKFGHLGLLIVDEEQSFGVGHKEQLRKLARNVHLLCMSATPIPRTMQLALAGVRDISLLDTPPRSRRAIRTYLLEDRKKYWEAALTRELERGGQSFVLHNRIEDLEGLADDIRALLPESRVAVAHGKLASGELESVLTSFAEGEFDILVCSTIIEAGVDLPKVNTMLVKDAHMFGLAQLYQIRGRVGRSERQAYCYLMVPKGAELTGKAQARLQTITDLTELGSGFELAQRDLEIRGAGDLLGEEQTGQMNRVGYRLYSELLQAALAPKGGAQTEQEGLSMDLRWDAYLPAEYVEPTSLRFDFYSRLARLENEEQIASLQEELCDRFGDPPAPVEALLDLTRLRLRAATGGVSKIEMQEQFGERSLQLTRGKKTEVVKDPPEHDQLLAFLLKTV